ncbi:hypothetical protein I203_101648 [Kwoniella mangroviensis CBS 8507]|uniref:uncharacterized protein n=1 Tax=Kwoniella mangroviensis CBS 8507 TaxID=1296122 RepID=UPI00080D46EC|nr:uncharacterized protein I203_07215 [Kwoniella mangroviensis CBS 8507]OCF63519.1 hypothetical protein I203_07215 [Kwoniella mangroviensis CBS 8507]
MMTNPRLLPVSSKGKAKWETITESITITVIARSSSNVEIHLIHRGRFIMKQSFQHLSRTDASIRKIIHSDTSMIFRYEPTQTPVISGMKMKESYQFKFDSNEDCQSFIQMMTGFFEISEAKQQSTIKGNHVEPSQAIPFSPSKVSKSGNTPFTSPTKASPANSSPESKRSPGSQERTKSRSKSKEESKSGDTPASTHSASINVSQKVEITAEDTPSPPVDEATERLKRALLGDYKLPPTPSDSQSVQQEHPSTSQAKGKSTQADTPLSVSVDEKITTDQSAGFPLNQSESQVTPRPKSRRTCGPSSSSQKDGIHASVNDCPGTPTKSQPLTDFSSQSVDHPTHYYQVSSPNKAKDVSTSEFMSVDGEDHLSNIPNIPIDDYPVLMTHQELEAERKRKGKRKRQEVEEDLTADVLDEEQDPVKHSQNGAQTRSFLNDAKTSPQLPYGRGIYDLATHDLENLVDQAMMESGFEKLVETIGHLIQKRLDGYTAHHRPTHLHTHFQETHLSNDLQCWIGDRTYQPYSFPSQSAFDGQTNDRDFFEPAPQSCNSSLNPFHNSHSEYRSYHSGSNSSDSLYYSLSQDLTQKESHHTYKPNSVAANSNHIWQSTVTPGYSPSLQAHSQHNHSQNTHIYPEQRRTQDGNINQLLQHSHIYSSPAVRNFNHPQYTQPGRSYPEYDYDNDQSEVYPPSPSKQSLSFILNSNNTDLQHFLDHTESASHYHRENQTMDASTIETTYEDKKTKLDEEDEELANISREFDNGSSSGSSNDVGEDEEEKEYDYDAMVDEDLELEKEIENEV